MVKVVLGRALNLAAKRPARPKPLKKRGRPRGLLVWLYPPFLGEDLGRIARLSYGLGESLVG